MMISMVLLMFACAPPPYDGQDGGLPSVQILFPNPDFMEVKDKDRPVCPSFQVVVAIQNFELVPTGSEATDLQGHWHLYLDDPDLTNRLAAPSAPVFDVLDPLSEGNHTLFANLRATAHGEIPEELRGEELAQAEITVEDSDDCIGNLAGLIDSGS